MFLFGQSDSTDIDLQSINKGTFDGIIVNYDTNYNILWNRNFGGSAEDYFRGTTHALNGSVSVGYSNSTDGDLQGLSKGSWDAVIVNYDSSGNIVWNYNFGGNYTDYFLSIANSPDNGYVVVGQSSSTNQDLQGLNKGIFDAIIAKYDSNGNLIWNHNFGGSLLDRFYSISPISDGYLVVGNSASNDQDLQGLNQGLQDAIIVKYDFDGNVVWNRNFGSTQNDYFYSCLETPDGYLAVGSLEDPSNANLSNAVIVKYDRNGNLIWNQSFGGSGTDIFYSLTKSFQNYIIVGSSNSTDGDLEGKNKGSTDAIIVSYDNQGNLLWNENFGGSNSETLYSIINDRNSYTTVGFSTSKNQQLENLNYGRQDAIIVDFQEPFSSEVTYSTTDPTPGPVTATLKTSEPIETPAGWTKINDTTFTKDYTSNIEEEVLLKTLTGKEYFATISISNIESPSSFPMILFLLVIFILLAIIICVFYYCYCDCYKHY